MPFAPEPEEIVETPLTFGAPDITAPTLADDEDAEGMMVVDEGTFAGRLAARLSESPVLEVQFCPDAPHTLVTIESIGDEWIEYRLTREDGLVADELSIIALEGVFNVRVESKLLNRVRMARMMGPSQAADD